jgi:hypothetical protein
MEGYFMKIQLSVLAIVFASLSTHATEPLTQSLYCRIVNPKMGETYLKFNDGEKTLAVADLEGNLSKVGGLMGVHSTVRKDPSPHRSPALQNDVLIHFRFGVQQEGLGSVRFYNALKADKDPVVAELISTRQDGDKHSINDFVFGCCFGKRPRPVPSQGYVSCQ